MADAYHQKANLSKICDGADWFDPEILEIITRELNLMPQFYRKQWEFAKIIQTLRRYGLLNDDKVGLSLGSGKELILYVIARQVKHLTVTDLYNTDTSWEEAKTNDADKLIRAHKPFPLDDDKLSIFNMDMRHLTFEDSTFDFSYSCCALEHIGTYEDFLSHFHEVYRVLKEGGIYIFTTELTLGERAIQHPNNYIFSLDYLDKLIAESKFIPDEEFDAKLTPHYVNFPIPDPLEDISFIGENHFLNSASSFRIFPQIQILSGRHPYTTCLFVLRKAANLASKRRIAFKGLADSRNFLNSALKGYGDWIRQELSLNPFSFLRGGISSFFAAHAQSFPEGTEKSKAIFHTNYYWLGAGRRIFYVDLKWKDMAEDSEAVIELRIHRLKSDDPHIGGCVFNESIPLQGKKELNRAIDLPVHDEYSYAVLAHNVKGDCIFSDIQVKLSKIYETASPVDIAPAPKGNRDAIALPALREINLAPRENGIAILSRSQECFLSYPSIHSAIKGLLGQKNMGIGKIMKTILKIISGAYKVR